MLKKSIITVLLIAPLFGVEIVINKSLDLQNSFTRDNTKEIVKNNITGLMWQDDVSVKSAKKNWSEAKQYCINLYQSGYSDWFLPSIAELESIVDTSRANSAIKREFQNSISSRYWSSSSGVFYSTLIAWYVNFENGVLKDGYKTSNCYIRCARSGQYDTLNFEKLLSNLMREELEALPKPKKELKLVRGEFESTQEFEARVRVTKRKQKKELEAYRKNYAQTKSLAQRKAVKKALEMSWGKPLLSHLRYDADSGYFVADIKFEMNKNFQKKVAIKVPRKYARAFKGAFDSLKPEAVFEYDGASVQLKDIRVPYKHKNYVALFTDLNIDETRVAVNLKNDIELDDSFSSSVRVASNSMKHLDSSGFRDYRELERLLKKTRRVKEDNKKWLFVVGIEKYAYTDNISYARRSATMFKQIMKKKLGVKESHCYTMLDEKASQARIKTNLKKMLRRVKSGDTIYFYYNGHGVPIPSLKNEPFMLASDSEPDYIADEKFFSLKNIYGRLSDSKAKRVVAFVDSCFSGVTDGKAVLKGVAATKMVARSVQFDKHKMVVLTAGKGNQYSNGYDKKGYRLFSFYLMQNILEGKKDIRTLYRETKSETYDTSLEEYGDVRIQEPQIEGNFRMQL